MQNTKMKKITAWIAMLAVVCVMLFSVVYISQHTNHDCTGNDCPVCAVLEQCESSIKNIGTAAILIAAICFLCLSIQKSAQYHDTVCFCCSLISQKVRMNN